MSEICQQDLTKKKGTPPSQMSRSKTLSLKTTSVHVVSLVPRSQQVYSGGGSLSLGTYFASFKHCWWAPGMGHSRSKGPAVQGASARGCQFSGPLREVGREQAVPFMKADPPCQAPHLEPCGSQLIGSQVPPCSLVPALPSPTASHLPPPALAPVLTLSLLPCYWQPWGGTTAVKRMQKNPTVC